MEYTTINGQLLKEILLSGAYELENNKELVNSLNVFPVPDGDTGTNMSATIMSAALEIQNVKNITVQSIADAAAMGSLMGARGNSGVILSQLLRGMSKQFKNNDTISTKDFANALKEGANTAYRAVMKPTEGTILTVAREMADTAIEISKSENDFTVFMKKIYEHALVTLNKTPDMLPVLKQAGVVDAGGKGLSLIYLGMYKKLQGENIVIPEEPDKQEEKISFTPQVGMENADIKFGYCTEFFIKTKNANSEEFKNKILKHGDSIVVVGTESLIKVHIHTNNPGTVLDEAIKYGELSKIKIDNMKEQHRHILEESSMDPSIQEIKKEEEKEFGIITVAMGDGIKGIFKDLGVDVVIEGGQTMNPSTQDILEAVNSLNAKNIFILPNNKNIIMAAEQARDMSAKNVIVVPTKSIPQGITAIIAFNSEVDSVENQGEMKKAMERVKTGQITFAVRNTVFNDVEIKEGNILGIIDGRLTKAGEDVFEVASEILNTMVDEESELITIFYGKDVTEEEVSKLQNYIDEKYPQCDVSLNYGGQPLYYYIVSVE